MRVIGEGQEKVLIILSCKNHIASIDPTREKSHAFVLNRLSVKSQDTEVKEVLGLDQSRQNNSTIVGRVSRVVDNAPIVFDKTNEACVLNAVALVRRDGKDNAFRHFRRRSEMNFVVGFRQPVHALQRSRHVAGVRGFVARRLLDGLIQLIKEEGLTQSSHDRGGPVILKSHLTQFVQEGAFMVGGLRIKLRQCYKRRRLLDLY